MITRMITAAAVGALALTAMPAAAQSVESKAIEAKNIANGKQKIAADRAYILVSGSARTQGLFYKTPNADDIEEYQAEWEEEFADALKKYERKVKSYEKDQEDSRKGRLPRGYKLAEKPDEVTRETFTIGSLERRLTVGWGPMYVFEKEKDPVGEDSYSYLIEVDPGEYTYYGAIFVAPNGSAMGVCMCMGSVKFEAKPGEVTNLGDFAAMRWIDDAAGRQSSVTWDEFNAKRAPSRAIDYTVPASLAGYNTVKADLRAAGKVDNWFGISIGRLPPMTGVLAYERDRIVDVKEASRLAALAKAEAEAKAKAEADAAAAIAATGEAVVAANASAGAGTAD